MKNDIQFILGSHCHIPISADETVFDETYKNKLKPFVSTLNKYPKIQATLHYSGVLLQWLERAHPEFFMLIRDLVSRKQVELLGGGFYEPLFPLIPFSDRIGQIELLTTYMRKQFGKRPQGCMLPLSAWENNLVGSLNTCGIKYTFLDEKQFQQAGLSGFIPCITEDQGKTMTIFPISGSISENFGRDLPDRVMERIVNDEERCLVCIFPERFFSESPDSESQEVILQRFFETLSSFDSSVEFTQPSKLLKNTQLLRKVYFPSSIQNTVFPENSFSHDDNLPREFLVKYPASNNIYAKMLFTHILIHHLRGDRERKKTAREELWKAQGYDSFCPTKDGGIFSHAVRKIAYKYLLKAERISRESSSFTPSLSYFDFDLDGEEEVIFQDDELNCYIKHKGASVFELDYLKRAWNYLDIFGEGVERSAFTDMFVSQDVTFWDFLEDNIRNGRFCADERFELEKLDKEHSKVCFKLACREDKPYGNISVEKSYSLKKNLLCVQYILRNNGSCIENFQFISSINLSFFNEGESSSLISDTESLSFHDKKNEAMLTVSANQQFDAWVKAVGNNNIYQSACIMPVKRISLNAGDSFQIEFRLQIQEHA